MKIAVTTPTGHVGSAVADFLLDHGDNQVKLLARRPHMLTRFVARGAEMAVGSQDDANYLTNATRDVDSIFWLTPPGYGSDNVRAFQNRLGNAAASAIQTNQVPRVVNLSSIGARWSSGVGPINGLHDVELILNEAAENILHLRPGFFFENLLWQLDSIRSSGVISLPLSGSERYPMIAARDIGRVAAHWLADPVWTGHDAHELHGPEDLSFDDVAEILSEALDRRVLFVPCDREQARHAMFAAGLSENASDLMVEMYDAVAAGKVRPMQSRSAETTTPTTLAEFAREVILPQIAEPTAH